MSTATVFTAIVRCLPALFVAASFTSCRTPAPEVVKAPEPPPLYEWKGDETPGALRVRIDLSEQKAQLYKGKSDVGWTYVATGRAGFATPAGTYKVTEKKADKASNRYGVIVNAAGTVVDWDAKAGREKIPAGGRFVGAPMPYWMRLTSYGIGMHAGPIPHPGSPASHGCIRLPEYIAQKLFENAVMGTSVSILP
jgi:lipoprotein-anchoring transpeptidase ErfK/SrfK